MPDDDPLPNVEPSATPTEIRNLPVPVPPLPSAPEGEAGEGWIKRALHVLFRWKAGTIRADLKTLLEQGQSGETGFSPEESTMLKNILALRERRIEDVMLPRADIVAVQQDVPLGELMRIFESAGHSRLVVYNDTLDDPVGMVHIRDLIAFMTSRAAVRPELNVKRKRPFPAGLDLRTIDLATPLSATQIVRTILFVPPSMPAMDLLAKMQATRIHLALIIDEYGGTDGLISIEDIVELIVGDIEDEHDVEEPVSIARQADGTFLADGRANLEDVVATIGAEFNVVEHLDEVDTLGGYLVTKAGHVPVRGELVSGPPGFEIEVLDADPRRVKRARIYRSKDRRTSRSRDGRRREEESEAAIPGHAGSSASRLKLQPPHEP